LDIKKNIVASHSRLIKDKGWLKSSLSAAKIPPFNILHGASYDRYARNKKNIYSLY